jgi:CelD/BcsL family acetyltransferase involved in cellulose biosynthesis
MEVNIVNNTEDFYRLKEAWEYLEAQDYDATYYSTFEYIKTWWEVYKNDKDKKLYIICVTGNKEVLGIAPLYIETLYKKVFSYNELRFLGQGDFAGLLINRQKASENKTIKLILSEILKNTKDYERVLLTNIKHTSALASYALKSCEINKYFTYLVECPQVIINNYKDFEEYRKVYKNVNAARYKNKLKNDIGYNLKATIDNGDSIIQKISDIHISEQQHLRYKKKIHGRSSLFEDPKRLSFISRLYKDNDKVITFTIETPEGEIIIYNTCYLYKRVLHSWNTGYDKRYENSSLGRIIIHDMVNYLFENRIADILDLGPGRYPWKFEWTSDFLLEYKLDMWNENTKKGRILKKLYDLKH